LLDLARTHSGVAIYFGVGIEAGALFLAGALDAFANSGGRLFAPRAGDIAIFHGRHFNVEIDAIEERTRDALAVTMDLGGAAAAFTFKIAEVSAWTRIPL
jgi:hypothetical protein